jgi:putative flippase GtrA
MCSLRIESDSELAPRQSSQKWSMSESGCAAVVSFRPIRRMVDLLNTRRETLLRLMRFLVVGGGTAIVQLAILWVLNRWLPETVAFVLSWVGSTATHYVANRYWALPSTRHDHAKQFGEYLFTIALSLVINTVAFRLLRDVAGVGLMWATLISIPPSTVVVFLMLNYRVFRPKQTET